MSEQKIKQIVRIVSTDIPGEKKIIDSLRKIPGIGHNFANAICSLTGLDKNKKTGALSESEVKKIEAVVSAPLQNNVPKWLINRRKDYDTGEDIHIFSSNLKFTQSNDIKRMQSIKCNIGLRHAWRLPVRGQRTQSNFRKNKGKVSIANKKTVSKH